MTVIRSKGFGTVRCPSCGFENLTASSTCAGCGKPLLAAKRETVKPNGKPSGSFDHTDIARKMKLDYSYGVKDKTEKTLDGILSWLSHCEKPQTDLKAILFEAADIIHKHLGLDNVSIGLRSASDDLFRYEVFVGTRSDLEAAHRKLAYAEKDFFDDTEYKGTIIGKISKLYLSEDVPYKDEEIGSYRAALLGLRRRSPTDSSEGDYIDFWIQGTNGKLLGWIEVSGTRVAQLPDIMTIKLIEIIASMIGCVLTKQGVK